MNILTLLFWIIMIVWLALGLLESRDRTLWPNLRGHLVAWVLFALLGYKVFGIALQ